MLSRLQSHPHIHCIGISGIGLSALARYYHALGYRVTGSNWGSSSLLEALARDGIEIVSPEDDIITPETQKILYTEAIIDDHTRGLEGVREVHKKEILLAQKYNIPCLTYPEGLAEVFQTFPMKIAVAGAHGKSTTSAMIGTLVHDVQKVGKMRDEGGRDGLVGWGATTITGTLVKAFGGKNVSVEGNDIMTIEACEYRNAFLHYFPDIAVITNIDPDHLDFFGTEKAYFEAFEKFMGQSRCIVMPAQEYAHFQDKMANEGIATLEEKGNTQNTLSSLVLVGENTFEFIGSEFNGVKAGTYPINLPPLLVPGDHIRIDASLAYVVSRLIGVDTEEAKKSLQNYPGSWRRMEILGTTPHNNLFMSDYGHHPTEIRATLQALREGYPDRKILAFFEPHQYSRTYELLADFATSFTHADHAYIVDIYAARDIDERREKINSQILAEKISAYSKATYVGNLDQAAEIMQKVDTENTHALLLLLGAGTIDELRTALSVG